MTAGVADALALLPPPHVLLPPALLPILVRLGMLAFEGVAAVADAGFAWATVPEPTPARGVALARGVAAPNRPAPGLWSLDMFGVASKHRVVSEQRVKGVDEWVQACTHTGRLEGGDGGGQQGTPRQGRAGGSKRPQAIATREHGSS